MKTKSIIFSIACIFIFFSTACSSGPKRSMLITTIHTSCNSSLEAANSCILSGDYSKAAGLLATAENQAVSIDNYDLLISVELAYVSLFLSYNPPKTAEAREYLIQAEKMAPLSNKVKYNNALCSMAETRILIAENNINQNFEYIIEEMESAEKGFKDDPYNQAQCFSIIGDLYRISGKFKDAEKAYNEAAKIFTSNRYLSEIGITWYKIAQNNSLSGDKKGALSALNTAIYYDRCAENTMALGADYYIMGVILLKGTPSQKEVALAEDAFRHSARIYSAANLPELAQRSLNMIK